ncbi:DNA polymerase alpha catalytic subunit-like [Cucurbita moschata]|uniref:DNA polymerase alpha catalytic subunit-like n=1 Tax=Cucurbita moschata TaxID=3662 RepID=A0A6J1F3G2_CUCMO|nr:DNA polymerase alpha catalytic subunit-like [Cucurbita moschata]
MPIMVETKAEPFVKKEGKGEELLILQQKFLVFNDERALFNRLMIELFKLDSDISGFDLDVLLHRSQFSEHQAGCGPKYVACTRLLCLNLGKESIFGCGASGGLMCCIAGRVLCDTYSLTEVAKTQLNKNREEVAPISLRGS